MDLKNIIVLVMIATVILIGYVTQQVVIVQLSYKLSEKEKKACELVDQNEILLYNNTSLKTPKYLSGMIKANSMDLELPDTSSVAKVRLTNNNDKTQVAKSSKADWNMQLADVVVPKVEAASRTEK